MGMVSHYSSSKGGSMWALRAVQSNSTHGRSVQVLLQRTVKEIGTSPGKLPAQLLLWISQAPPMPRTVVYL
eukprot:10448948-Prorocentrum_lima.AAC.1